MKTRCRIVILGAAVCCLLILASHAFCGETTVPLVHGGKWAVRVVNDCEEWKPGMDMGFDRYNSLIAVTPGQKLRVSFWMRYDGEKKGVLARMSIPMFSDSGHLQDVDLLKEERIPGSWTFYVFDCTVPRGAKRINVAFRPQFLRDNSLLIDDVSVIDTRTSAGVELCTNGGFEMWPAAEGKPPVGWRYFSNRPNLGGMQRVDVSGPIRAGASELIDADYAPE